MPDRFEQKRDELVKNGMDYHKAQIAKQPPTITVTAINKTSQQKGKK
jgi:hypothetical protein